jgi:hypothetical protein
MLFEEFQQFGVSFISLQENIDFSGPIGRLIFQIFGSLAQFERELIKGRTYAGKITSAEMGNYTRGDTPYGYRKIPSPKGKGKRLELIATEKAWIETIYDWYIYKGWGDLKIANQLNQRKVPVKMARKRTKAKWTEKRVRHLLTCSLYSGHFVAFSKDEEGQPLPPSEQTVVQVPPCVSEVLYRQAQAVRKTRVGGHASYDYLLSGKLVDVSSNVPQTRSFVGAKRTKGGYSYRRKRFKVSGTETYIPNFELPAAPLEEFVWNKVMSAFQNPAAFIQKYIKLNQQSEQIETIDASLKSLRLRQAQIEGIELPNSEKAYLKGVFSEERFARVQIELNQELEQVNGKIDQMEQDLEGLAWVRTEAVNLKAASKDLKGKLATLTREHKKMLCSLFVDRVEITRTERVGEKRKVTADVYFRCNLSQLAKDPTEVCTASGQSGTMNSASSPTSNAVGGQRGRSGYVSPRITAEYAKIRKTKVSKGVPYCRIESFWQELCN